MERCVLIGDSSGGNIVHHVAARAVEREKERSERSKSEAEVPPVSIRTWLTRPLSFCRASTDSSVAVLPNKGFWDHS